MSYPPVYSTLRVNTHTHDIDQIKGDVENKLEEVSSISLLITSSPF